MFLQACAKNSVQGGCLPHCMLGYTLLSRPPSLGRQSHRQTPLPEANAPDKQPLGRHPLGRHPWADTLPKANTPPRQTPSSGQTPLGRHPRTATAADGMHPTGMHSCYVVMFISCTYHVILYIIIHMVNIN